MSTEASELAELVSVQRLGRFAAVDVASYRFHADMVRRPASLRRRSGLLMKRGFDIVASAIGLIVLAPLLGVVALLILWHEGSPVFFVQERVGINGKVFRMVKFRTMARDAEARLPEVSHFNEIAGPAFQIDQDPRVTKFGRRLRRSSLDELPQLWNTLTGDMSIVGPRPAPVVEVMQYDDWHRRRLQMKPGITGLAQISIRRYVDFDDRARLDIRYIERWSPALDVRVLLMTVPVVLRASGR